MQEEIVVFSESEYQSQDDKKPIKQKILKQKKAKPEQKVAEISQAIAQMDAERKQIRKQKLQKLAEQQQQQIETNQQILQRLNNKFDEEEDDEEYEPDNKKGSNYQRDFDDDYQDNDDKPRNRKRRALCDDLEELNRGGKQKKRQTNNSKSSIQDFIKTNNKLFKEVNFSLFNQEEEMNIYENNEEQQELNEEILEENIQFERTNTQQQKNIKSFQIQQKIYKKQLGIEDQETVQPTINTNNSFNNNSRILQSNYFQNLSQQNTQKEPIEDCEIQLEIPQMKSSNLITNNTLFVSKISRQNSLISQPFQKVLMQQNSENSQQQQSRKNGFSREELVKTAQQKIIQNKSKNITIENIKNKFVQTTLESIDLKNDKKKNQEQNQNEQKEETSSDSDFEIEQKEEKQNENKELNQEELNYKKLLALEEGVELEELEQKKDKKEELKENYNKEQEEEEEDEGEEEENDSEQSEQNQENEETEKGLEINQILSKRLKKKSELKEALKKKQQEEIRKKREERAKQRQQMLANPQMRKILNDMIDDEAELGSDNEENDDKVKQIVEDDERKQAGLNENENLDDELKEIINNQVDINQENERLAQQQFIKDLNKRDREEVEQILNGLLKGRKRKYQDNEDLDREKRIENAIKNLQEDESEEDADEDDLLKDNKLFEHNIRKENEKEIMHARQQNILLKKQMDQIDFQFDENKIVDQSIFSLLQKNNNASTQNCKINTDKKNSVLNVKLNKNKFSQFNETFNKESLINEFGEQFVAPKSIPKNKENNNFSLNKIFSMNTLIKAKPSTNKLMVFGQKKVKNNN